MKDAGRRPEGLIGADELLRNCFSEATLERARLGRIQTGPGVAQLSWEVEGLEQVVWILYDPVTRDQLEGLAEAVSALSRQVDGKLLILDDFELKSGGLPLQMILLCDGLITWTVMSLSTEGGATGHVAVFAGQGRSVDTDDPKLPSLLQAIIANLFSTEGDDPFIRAGKDTLGRILEAAAERGHGTRRINPC